MKWDDARPIDLTSYRRQRRPSLGWMVGQALLLVFCIGAGWFFLVEMWAIFG